MTNETTAAQTLDEYRSPTWERSIALDDAASECFRAEGETKFSEEMSEDHRSGYRTACRLLAMSLRVMASKAAPNAITLPAAVEIARLTAANEAMRKALTECAAPFFWTKDGFWPDASTPAHMAQEHSRRLSIARAALASDASTIGGEG